MHLRGAFKIKKHRNLGKIPKFQLRKVKKEGGVHHILKKSQVSKSSQVWKIMHYFHLMRTLKQKILYFFALKMANNTLILKIVVDFVSKVPIFQLFPRFWMGSFCLKMFPSLNISQVPFRRGGALHFNALPLCFLRNFLHGDWNA